MRSLDLDRLLGLIERFSDVHLLVVGDLVLDEYLWGDVDRVSPEAPVPVVHVRKESVVLGGAANVVRNAVALGGSTSFCSIVGDDADGLAAVDLLKHLGVDAGGLVRVEGRPTTRKTRIIARSQQVVRFDRETIDAPPDAAGAELLQAIERRLPAASCAVVEDYGKGVLSRNVVRGAMRRFRDAGVPVVVDPKTTVAPFKGAALIKPNLREAEALTGITIRTADDLQRAAEQLSKTVDGASVVVTRGSEGMSLFEHGQDPVTVPTVAREVFDVQGAGDTTIAALALALHAGATLLEAAVIANAAAGVVVGKFGTATASAAEVCELLPTAIAAAEETA